MKNKNTLPKWLVTVTPLSKFVALCMLVFLPFIGFILGQKYTTYVNSLDNKIIPTPIKQMKYTNKVEKTTKADGTLEIKLTLVGKIENLNITDINIPYRHKIVLYSPVTDKDAIADARGEDIPKTEYVLLTYDEETIYKLNDSINKKVLITGTLGWGFAETRYLKVDSVKIL